MRLAKYALGILAVAAILIAVTAWRLPKWPMARSVFDLAERGARAQAEFLKWPTARSRFDLMTPAQHLAEVKSILQVEDPAGLSADKVDEVGRHIGAIPGSAPESAEAVALGMRLLEKQALHRRRQHYIDDLREEFRGEGVDAFISDVKGELRFISPMFDSGPGSALFVRGFSGAENRKNLCIMGFKSYSFNGETYSLGCPETKEEKAERLEKERLARQDFVDGLQKDFDRLPPDERALVSQENNELVITMPDFTPEAFRAIYASPEAPNKRLQMRLCRIGFRGVRGRDGTSAGTFIPFGCPARK